MSFPRWIGVSLVWVMSLVAAGAWAYAQEIKPPLLPIPMPMVVAGNDIGFRVEGRRGDTPVGRFVIRSSANGQWVEPELSEDAKRLIGK